MTMINSQAKQGYKHTPLGWIPAEWDFIPIGNVVKYLGGNAFDSKDSINKGIRWLKIANVGVQSIKWDEQSFLPSDFEEKFKGFLLFDGDVVMALTRPILNNKLKIAKINKSDEPCLLNQRVAKLVPRKNTSLDFLYYIHQTSHFVFSMYASMAGTDPPNIGNGNLEEIRIILPPLPEQKAIAKALSTWDEAISKTQELITQKELRKKWLMQKLFNFENLKSNSKTEMVRFENHFKFIRSYAAPRESLTTSAGKDSVYCIHYGDIHAYYENEFLDFAKQDNIPVFHNEASIDKEDLIKDGDIIMADASEDIEGVAELVEVINIGKKKAVGGLHTIVFRQRSKKFIPRYIAYLFNTNSIRNELRKKSTGTSVYSIGKSTLNRLKFLAHSDTETQIRVVKILEAADKEIELLKTKLESLKEQKKGLMQVLLSGKKRIKT